DFFKVHGGLVGESLFWVTRTLFSTIGADLIFVFLLIVGLMLLTGATLSGVIASLRPREPDPPAKAKRVRAPEVEPAVVRQTHVEAPVIDDDQPVWAPDPEAEPEPAPVPEAEAQQDPEPEGVVAAEPGELTPMGNKRGGLT